MMRKQLLFGVVMLWCIAMAAQGKPPDSVCQVNLMVPKPGMTQQFETGRKAHSAFHKANNAWPVWIYSIETGDATGAYVAVECGHSWKDFDAASDYIQKDAADANKNFGSTLAKAEQYFYVYRPELSRSKETGTPAKMMTVTHYWLDPAMTNDVIEAIKKVNAGIDTAKYPAKPSRWYSLASGGDVPHFVLVTDRTNFADMEPPAQTLDEALGPDGAQALATIRKASKKIFTELNTYRPDLSYAPAAK